MISNNVTRLLDSKKVHYAAFELPAEKLGAAETAEYLRIPVSLIFKSIIVVRPQGKPLVCVIPGDRVVDLKAVAQLVSEKKVSIPTQADAENMTGLLTGGISPFALLNKGFTIFLDQAAMQYDEIHLSGGQRGLILRLAPKDVVMLTGARVANVSKEKRE